MYPAATDKLLRHLPALAGMVRRAALAAGVVLMDEYDPSGFTGAVETKPDGSPVTHADIAADQVIRDFLYEHCPGIPMITEETLDQIDHDALRAADHYWLIDGMDGTKAFRRGEPDFTVNIALICRDQPVLGVLYAPAHGQGFLGVIEPSGNTAIHWHDDKDRDDDMHVREIPPGGLTLLTAQTQTPSRYSQALFSQVKINKHYKRSSSIKYAEVAVGRADLVVTTRDIYFWDTAAGDAVIRAAGGHVVDLTGAPLRYDRTYPDLTNHGLLACGDLDYFAPVLHELEGMRA